ncbi:hypothetical protein BSPLISOX_180 [uncultured Gammaproteobacteria bacterium]|nr:hypothetical protein [uncultured Gammaproteobacteria bacterium]VVH64555.1 hypothetical protein BSPLISOX_180 [uncultured Gammaproteobacteria bacterium]
MNSFWYCFVGEKNDYYTLFMVLLFFEFGIKAFLALARFLT